MLVSRDSIGAKLRLQQKLRGREVSGTIGPYAGRDETKVTSVCKNQNEGCFLFTETLRKTISGSSVLQMNLPRALAIEVENVCRTSRCQHLQNALAREISDVAQQLRDERNVGSRVEQRLLVGVGEHIESFVCLAEPGLLAKENVQTGVRFGIRTPCVDAAETTNQLSDEGRKLGEMHSGDALS